MRSRVHFINRFFHPDHSATSQILSGVAFDLADRGHDVHVTTSRLLYEDAQARLPREETISGVKVHRVASTSFGRSSLIGRAADYASFYLGTAWGLWRCVKRGDVVIAKTDPPMLSLVAAPIARLRGAMYVNWMQDVFPEVATGVALGGKGGQALARPLLALRNWTLGLAHRNIAIGERMAEHLAGQGASRESLAIIPNWADPQVVAPVPHAQNDLRREWGLEGKMVIGYSGNLGRVHDVDTIVEAMDRVQQRNLATTDAPEIVFVFIGGGAKRRELEQAVAARGLTCVQFRPYQAQERLSETLALADVHLVSLLPDIEGLVVPSKIYGIMAVGRPTIFVGSMQGEIARLVQRHGFGVSVEIGDGERLAEAIMAMAGDTGSSRSHGAQRAAGVPCLLHPAECLGRLA